MTHFHIFSTFAAITPRTSSPILIMHVESIITALLAVQLILVVPLELFVTPVYQILMQVISFLVHVVLSSIVFILIHCDHLCVTESILFFIPFCIFIYESISLCARYNYRIILSIFTSMKLLMLTYHFTEYL
jgi:hypothetical protein